MFILWIVWRLIVYRRLWYKELRDVNLLAISEYSYPFRCCNGIFLSPAWRMFFDSFYLLSSLSSSIIFARALASANYCWIRRVSLSHSAAFRFFINLCSSSSSATFNFSITVWSLRPLLLIKLPFDKDFDYLDDLLHPFLKPDLLDSASSSPLSVSFGQL